MNTRTVRILTGAVVGAQADRMVARAVPGQFQANSDMIVIAALAVYLMWGARPHGTLGDIVDGAAIGVVATTATRVVTLPVG